MYFSQIIKKWRDSQKQNRALTPPNLPKSLCFVTKTNPIATTPPTTISLTHTITTQVEKKSETLEVATSSVATTPDITTTPTPIETPVVTTPTPITPVEATVATTPTPITPVEAPVATTPTPITPVEAPVVTTPAPITPTEAPVATTPAPITPVEAPVVTTPAPVETASIKSQLLTSETFYSKINIDLHANEVLYQVSDYYENEFKNQITKMTRLLQQLDVVIPTTLPTSTLTTTSSNTSPETESKKNVLLSPLSLPTETTKSLPAETTKESPKIVPPLKLTTTVEIRESIHKTPSAVKESVPNEPPAWKETTTPREYSNGNHSKVPSKRVEMTKRPLPRPMPTPEVRLPVVDSPSTKTKAAVYPPPHKTPITPPPTRSSISSIPATTESAKPVVIPATEAIKPSTISTVIPATKITMPSTTPETVKPSITTPETIKPPISTPEAVKPSISVESPKLDGTVVVEAVRPSQPLPSKPQPILSSSKDLPISPLPNTTPISSTFNSHTNSNVEDQERSEFTKGLFEEAEIPPPIKTPTVLPITPPKPAIEESAAYGLPNNLQNTPTLPHNITTTLPHNHIAVATKLPNIQRNGSTPTITPPPTQNTIPYDSSSTPKDVPTTPKINPSWEPSQELSTDEHPILGEVEEDEAEESLDIVQVIRSMQNQNKDKYRSTLEDDRNDHLKRKRKKPEFDRMSRPPTPTSNQNPKSGSGEKINSGKKIKWL